MVRTWIIQWEHYESRISPCWHEEAQGSCQICLQMQLIWPKLKQAINLCLQHSVWLTLNQIGLLIKICTNLFSHLVKMSACRGGARCSTATDQNDMSRTVYWQLPRQTNHRRSHKHLLPYGCWGISPHTATPPAVISPKKYVVLHNTVCPENQQVRALTLGQGRLLCSCVFIALY